MTNVPDGKPIPDPAKQNTDAADTSIVPDMEADPVEREKARTGGLDEDLEGTAGHEAQR